ncbi:MAG: hypothetical protein IKZ82_02675 [Clostridia bacterium]|nr:hypothetical protein [Clostridia bacterium]
MEVLYIHKKKRRRFKKSVLVVVAFILMAALLLLLALMHFGGSEGKVRTARIETESSVTAVVIRAEDVVSGGEYDIADRYLSEGQRVRAGERVMAVYKLGFSREIPLALWRTRQDIYKAQLEVLGEARDVELRSYDNSVEKTVHEISDAVLSGGEADVLELKNKLTGLLTDRAEYLRTSVQETETLRALYRQQDEREQAVSDSRISLIAEKEGLVSYYFDDYSVALNADKLSTASAELIDSIVKKNGKSLKWMGSSKTSAYRLVRDGEWYLAFTTPASQSMRIVRGESYPLSIAGYGEYEGVGESSFLSGQRVVNIIKVNAPLAALIDVRTVKVKINFAFEGLRVEKRAVQLKDGEPFVEVMVDGKRMGVYVNVYSEDGSGAIVSPKNTANAPLMEGVKYWIPKKSVFKK